MAIDLKAGPTEASSRPATGAGAIRTRRWLRLVCLVATDGLALVVAGGLAYLSWAWPVHGQPISLYAETLVLIPMFWLGYAQMGLYPGFGLGPVERLRRLSVVAGFVFLLAAALTFVLKLPPMYSRMTYGLTAAMVLVLVPLTRSLVMRIGARQVWWREPCLVLARRHQAAEVEAWLASRPGVELEMVGLVLVDPETLDPNRLEEAAAYAAGGGRLVLVEAALLDRAEVLEGLQERFRHVIRFVGGHRLPVEGTKVRNLEGRLGVEYTNNLLQRRNQVAKRALDLVLGTGALMAVLPLLALLAVAVRLSSRGPVVFRQERVGRGEQPLSMPKLRTMRLDAEDHLARHLESDPGAREEWSERFKLRRDPRLIPGLGPFLRRYSLDELPQLWCVLTGEMSLVGPRPFPAYHVAGFPSDFRRFRSRVRPGLTGLWQVTVRAEGTLEDQVALDGYYIRNWSIWLDLYVLSRTLGAVLSGRGAY